MRQPTFAADATKSCPDLERKPLFGVDVDREINPAKMSCSLEFLGCLVPNPIHDSHGDHEDLADMVSRDRQ